jgi:hypothetical protein
MDRRGGVRVRTWICAVIILAIAVGACGSRTKTTVRSPAKRPSGRLGLDDIHALSGCTAYGHSYVEGYGLEPSQTFAAKVCTKFIGDFANRGISGSSIQSQLLATLHSVPHDASTQLSLVMWGINDLGAFGPSMGGYEGALRLLVSRLRTADADVHDFRDPALGYSGRWIAATGENLASEGSSFSWRSPPGFRGGEVTFMMMAHRGFGARYAFTLDGAPAGAFDTRGVSPRAPAAAVSTPVAYRVRVPAGGGHVIGCTLEHVRRAANLVGWALEAAHPPLVVLVQQPRLPSYYAYRVIGAPFLPNDASVRALNQATEAVAAEFDNYVITVDTDRAIGKQRRYFQGDGLHPNAAGDERISQLIEAAIERDPHVLSPS